MPTPWRLLVDAPAPGDWNMAVDDLLLQRAADPATAPCLRLYGWREPTLSLGYFQKLDDVPPDLRRRLPIVRRATGGGAILHDREVTYAVALRQDFCDGPALYDRLNRALLLALDGLGIAAEPADAGGNGRAQRGPFFCFARPGATDIIAASRKLAGGAQRRRDGAVLQHGSVLLEGHTSMSVGIHQITDRAPTAECIRRALADAVAAEFSATMAPSELTDDERQRAEDIRRTRYANAAWLERGNRGGTS